MKIKVHLRHFQDIEQARAEIEAAGLHPVEMTVPAVSNESHWHDFSTWLYILEGELRITDIEEQHVFLAGRGARVVVPERVLHCENSEQGYRIIAGMTVDPATLSGEVDLDPDLL